MPVEALVVDMRRRGPGQMGNAGLLDTLTSGEYSSRIAQLDRLELALKISIVASCIAGIAGLATLLSRK